MGKRKTTEQFIAEARLVHGDNYNYSKFIYLGAHIKGIIICPIHGEFEQSPHVHLKGCDCKLCGTVSGHIKQRSNSEEFIRKAKLKHGNRYDYSKVNYVDQKTEVVIICKIHGDFEQTPKNHLKGHRCIKCVKTYRATEDFIKEASIVHNNKYDYSKTIFIKTKSKVIIICPNHGEFKQLPDDHLDGHGCKKCGDEETHNKQRSNTEEFILKANKKHKNRYTYLKTNYIDASTEVIITCTIHDDFEQLPSSHLDGKGCPECGKLRNISENKIRDLLIENNIDFEQNYKNKLWLGRQELDFYLEKYNIAIEYQGIQHFELVPYFGGKEKFSDMIRLDKKKYELCKAHNIKLLYFTYEKRCNIENYLDKVYNDENELINKIKEIVTNLI